MITDAVKDVLNETNMSKNDAFCQKITEMSEHISEQGLIKTIYEYVAIRDGKFLEQMDNDTDKLECLEPLSTEEEKEISAKMN